jgi:hypothetical protein
MDTRLSRSRSFGDPTRRLREGAALLGLALSLSVGAADETRARDSARPPDKAAPSQEQTHVWMTIGTARFAVTLEDNPTASAFARLLPATFDMTELNGNEKYVHLPSTLPSKPVRPGTIRAGDILLYGNNSVVVFYETFQSSYSYTRIGRITEPAGLAQALGLGNQRVAFTVP